MLKTKTNGFSVCMGRRTMAARLTKPIRRRCCSCLSRWATDAAFSVRHHDAELLLGGPSCFPSFARPLSLCRCACSSSLESEELTDVLLPSSSSAPCQPKWKPCWPPKPPGKPPPRARPPPPAPPGKPPGKPPPPKPPPPPPKPPDWPKS